MNISKTADVKQLTDSLLLKKQKKLLQHLQEVCNINITDSQHLFSEKKLNIVQKQDTESTKSTESTESTKLTKQSHQCKPKINLLPTHQSTQMRCSEHSEHFADEFRYDSILQSHE